MSELSSAGSRPILQCIGAKEIKKEMESGAWPSVGVEEFSHI